MSHDHSQHDHSGHGGMDMPGMDDGKNMCNMNMLFTWSFNNLCIVFPSWQVTGPISALLSLIAVILLTAGYEAIRDFTRRYEEALERRLKEGGLRRGSSASDVEQQQQKGRLIKAVLYGVQVFYSFFIMLLFMTYNGWIMIAVGVGATLGYLMFGAGSVTKSAACH